MLIIFDIYFIILYISYLLDFNWILIFNTYHVVH